MTLLCGYYYRKKFIFFSFPQFTPSWPDVCFSLVRDDTTTYIAVWPTRNVAMGSCMLAVSLTRTIGNMPFQLHSVPKWDLCVPVRLCVFVCLCVGMLCVCAIFFAYKVLLKSGKHHRAPMPSSVIHILIRSWDLYFLIYGTHAWNNIHPYSWGKVERICGTRQYSLSVKAPSLYSPNGRISVTGLYVIE